MNASRWWLEWSPGSERLGVVVEHDATAPPCPVEPPDAVTRWVGPPTLVLARPHSGADVYIDRTTTARRDEARKKPPKPKRGKRTPKPQLSMDGEP